jgi:hypothetical protein
MAPERDRLKWKEEVPAAKRRAADAQPRGKMERKRVGEIAEPPKGPVQFYLHHVPTGELLGTYPKAFAAHDAKEALEREDPEGAARGDYKVTWSFTFELPKVGPHRFELGVLNFQFGPICSVCKLPVDFAPHTNREEAWAMMDRF